MAEYVCDYCKDTFVVLSAIEAHLVGVHGKAENPTKLVPKDTDETVLR